MITIETSLENFTCSIFDVNGNLLISTEKINSGEELSIKSLKPGMYLITINDGEQSLNYKFTKSNE
ncbi:MAG: T9SS type A sorting domain-containing protein [Bacteroidetes bacterium]|nr:T9SS type A sorting domain-containing protein [Bacteroidota bacterium]